MRLEVTLGVTDPPWGSDWVVFSGVTGGFSWESDFRGVTKPRYDPSVDALLISCSLVF